MHTARGRLHSHFGETDLALADLDSALRHDPDDVQAPHFRTLVEQERGRAQPAVGTSGQSEHDQPAIDAGLRPHTRFKAGHRVMARYPDRPGCDEHLGLAHPFTALGRLQAVEFARRMCSGESRTQPRELYDAHWTGGEEFDTVVIEFRSLAREVYLEKALDGDSEPIE